eukprot:9648599-Alexandrium_andersonii.AAC.1
MFFNALNVASKDVKELGALKLSYNMRYHNVLDIEQYAYPMKVGKEDNAHIAPIRVLIKAWKDTALKTESHATAAAVTKTLAVHATGSSIAAPIT